MGRRKLMEDEALLSRVREIVVRDGIAVSSRKIAKEIGISDSVLFQRFGSKVELLFAAMTPPAPDMSNLLGKDVRRGDTLAQLERLAWGLLEYFRAFVPVILPLAVDPAFNYEAFRKRNPDSTLDRLMVQLMTALEAKRKSGEIDCPDAGEVVLSLVAVTHSLAMFERIGIHGRATFNPSTVRDLVRLLWRGIAPEPRSQRPAVQARHGRKARDYS